MKTIGENPMQSKKKIIIKQNFIIDIVLGFCFFNLLNFYFFGTAFEEKKKT